MQNTMHNACIISDKTFIIINQAALIGASPSACLTRWPLNVSEMKRVYIAYSAHLHTCQAQVRMYQSRELPCWQPGVIDV